VLGTYRYKIKKINSEPDKEFQVFSVYFNIHPVTSSNSLAMPNEGARVLTVGAVHRTNWSKPAAQVRVEPYSSRGPSKTGRCKPDLVGVDGMTNAAYGHFPGTSAASPSVAGLAALILSKQPYLSAYQLRYSLVDNCVDIWTNGPDNETGAGRPVLSLFPLRRNSSQIVSNNLIVAPTRVKRGERVYYYGVSASTLIRLRTVSGLLIGEYKADDGVYSTGENFIQLPASGLADGVFVLEFEDASARSPKFYRKIVVEP
jgi:subtilisin family serine protease